MASREFLYERPLCPVSRDRQMKLRATFPNGVCDYSKPGVGQVPLAGTWLMFMGDARTISIAAN